MAAILRFRGQQVGDGLVLTEPISEPATPPVTITGLWRGAARLDATTRNYLWAERCVVFLKRPDPFACATVLAAIRDLQGLAGRVEILSDSVRRFHTLDDWVCHRVDPAGLLAAFGGRFVSELVIVFAGGSQPVRS